MNAKRLNVLVALPLACSMLTAAADAAVEVFATLEVGPSSSVSIGQYVVRTVSTPFIVSVITDSIASIVFEEHKFFEQTVDVIVIVACSVNVRTGTSDTYSVQTW